MLLKPLRASASAAARPPMPPPAMMTGFLFLEEDGDAIDLAFGIHQIDTLMRDAECIALAAQAMLDQRGVDALFLVAELHHGERGCHAHFRGGVAQDRNVADLVHRACEWQPRMRAWMADLLYAQLEERAVIVDDG